MLGAWPLVHNLIPRLLHWVVWFGNEIMLHDGEPSTIACRHERYMQAMYITPRYDTAILCDNAYIYTIILMVCR